MIKNIIVAIFLGILTGFAITSGLFKLKNQSIINKITPTPTPSVTEVQTPTPIDQSIAINTSKNITIDSHEDEDIVNKPTITLSGQAPADSYIIIRSPLNTYFTNTSSSGKFSQDIDLEAGANKIFVTAIDKNDQQSDLEIYLTYSTSKI